MASAPLQPGTLLNQRYNILDIVGQGGMGTVYKAEHAHLHAVSAIKEIRGTGIEGTEKQQDLAACEHEAQFLVKLDHPHLPKVTDAFIDNENFYLVMQFIEGVTLDSRLTAANGAALDVLQSVEWGLQIAGRIGLSAQPGPAHHLPRPETVQCDDTAERLYQAD